MTDLPTCLYEPDGDRLVPTGLTRGPWDPRLQHAGPPSALLGRAVERAAGLHPGGVGRIAIDVLRPVPLLPLAVSARVLRPGRRVEQVEAVLALAEDGTELMRAAAWRIRIAPVALPAEAAPAAEALPGPETGAEGDLGFWREQTIAYHAALDWRFVSGGFDRPGPAAVWTRLRVPLVAGEEPSQLERLLVMADAASGVSAVLDWSRFLFINVDLNIHLERLPEGEWIATDAVTRPGPQGAGLCVGVLHDLQGRVGLSTQSLLIDKR